MKDKITISLEETRSRSVEEKLNERAVDTERSRIADESSTGFLSQFFYNTAVYTLLFGLVGGLLAALFGELFFFATRNEIDELQAYFVASNEIIESYNLGEISDQEYSRKFSALAAKYADNLLVQTQIEVTNAGEFAFDDRQMSFQQIAEYNTLYERANLRNRAYARMWFCGVGITLAVFLSIADPAMSRNGRGVVVNAGVAAAIGLVGSFVGYFIANFVYRLLLAGDGEPSLVLQIIARSIGWGIIGGFLAVAPGVVLQSAKRSVIGLVGGIIGGTLGGVLFDGIAIAANSDELSRIVALIAIGGLTGLGSGLLEAAAKTAWLRVAQGLIAGKQFVLYKDITSIGSSPQCEIYLFKDADISPRHAVIRRRGNHFEIEDQGSATSTFVNGAPITRTRLNKGDRIQIGRTLLVFMEKNKQA